MIEKNPNIEGLQEVIEVGLCGRARTNIMDASGMWSLEKMDFHINGGGMKNLIAVEKHGVPFGYVSLTHGYFGRQGIEYKVEAKNPYDEEDLAHYIENVTGTKTRNSFGQELINHLLWLTDDAPPLSAGTYISITLPKSESEVNFDDVSFQKVSMHMMSSGHPPIEPNELRVERQEGKGILIYGNMEDIDQHYASLVKKFVIEKAEYYTNGFTLSVDQQPHVASLNATYLPPVQKATGLEALSVPMPNMEVDINDYSRIFVRDARGDLSATYVPKSDGSYLAYEMTWDSQNNKWNTAVSRVSKEEVQEALFDAIEAHLDVSGMGHSGHEINLMQQYFRDHTAQQNIYTRREELRDKAITETVYGVLSYDFNDYKNDFASGPYRAELCMNENGSQTAFMMKDDKLIAEMEFSKSENGEIIPSKTILYGDNEEGKQIIEAVELFNSDVRDMEIGWIDMRMESPQKDVLEATAEAVKKLEKNKPEMEM